jgi:hypothetical protein
MPKNQKYSGLCETCEHDETCTLRRSTVLKIIQCEEFSIQPTATAVNPIQDEEPQADLQLQIQMGLCANCLNLPTCGFPNARHGVQQCEEYILDEAGVVPPVQKVRSESAA